MIVWMVSKQGLANTFCWWFYNTWQWSS